MENPIKLIDMSKAFNRLRRKYDKCIFYNDNCFIKLQAHEMKHIQQVLSYLYMDYYNNKENKDWRGLKHSEASLCFEPNSKNAKFREQIYRATVWMLIPQFVDVRTWGGNQRMSKRYKLNPYGVKLVETLMEDTKKAQEKQQEKETGTANNYIDDEEEIEGAEDADV